MYDENIAKTLADYCAAAYSCGSFQGCGNWSCKSCQLHPNAESLRFSGGTNGTGVGRGSVSGMVIHDPDLNKVILAFAGTQVTDLIVWANNLNGELIDYPACGGNGCQVHAGFYADYQAIAPSLKESLGYVLARYPQSGLWIAGHSLGGALAMLAVADLKGNHSIHAEAVYTFGQPRVGNQAFAMHLYDITGRAQPPHAPTPYFRLVHYQDPIPHAPPVLLGFWHAPTEIFYTEDQTSYQVCNDSGEDFYCSNSFLFAYRVEDHLNYLGVPF
ncbi:lipase [Nannochloropsis oceanica]